MLISYGTRYLFVERLRRLFGGMPCRLQVAALPWRMGSAGIEVMLVTSRETRRWVLPKGWREKQETNSQAAAREAAEEAGVTGSIAGIEIGRYFYSKRLRNGMEWRCEVLVYPLEVDREAAKWPERRKRTRHWFPAHEAARLVDERDLAELIAGFTSDPRKFAA